MLYKLKYQRVVNYSANTNYYQLLPKRLKCVFFEVEKNP